MTRERWITLVVVSAATAMLLLDVTVVNVALPVIAMVGVLSHERGGLASGVNNTFRQLGIAVGISALGAIFQHHVGLGAPTSATAVVDALDTILLVSAAVALAGAALAWPLLGNLRSAQTAAVGT